MITELFRTSLIQDGAAPEASVAAVSAFAAVRRWNDNPFAADTSSIALAAPGARLSRIMTAALDHGATL